MAASYQATLTSFVSDDPTSILGLLSKHTSHNELQKKQIRAWEREVEVFKCSCAELIARRPETGNWFLLFEYWIPRRSKRIDAVILADDLIFCVEFKTEDKKHSPSSQRQVEDYALDLRDFHEASRGRIIIPVVVVPKAPDEALFQSQIATDSVRPVRLANGNDFASILLDSFENEHSDEAVTIDLKFWVSSAYRPVSNIIEAAEALFAGHSVREIDHAQAGKADLVMTSERILGIIQAAQEENSKVICFVTGVPGSGKTLVGLGVAHNPLLREEDRPSGVFLSGNGPLVKIVSAAIARDFKHRHRRPGGERPVGTMIQNVHIFVRDGMEKVKSPPHEHVVIFDEAQRSWDANQNQKKNGLEVAEAETIMSIMDRHSDWAVIVALVGAGQEINTGGAGLSQWGHTLREKFPHWRVLVSPRALVQDSSNAGQVLFSDGDRGQLKIEEDSMLHLSVNRRSFRAQRIVEWVDAVLAGDSPKAAAIISQLFAFPFALTRSLTTARQWLRKNARGRQRAGLVASSGALRLRAYGIELSTGFRQGNRDMFVNWFLNHLPDVRSSNQLEVAASEFECQGLELDWVGVCWGGDFCVGPVASGWEFRNFSGSRWSNLKSDIDKRFVLNTYRVLLTRARRGSVIWVPQGDEMDDTRMPGTFQFTADYLAKCGLPVI